MRRLTSAFLFFSFFGKILCSVIGPSLIHVNILELYPCMPSVSGIGVFRVRQKCVFTQAQKATVLIELCKSIKIYKLLKHVYICANDSLNIFF